MAQQKLSFVLLWAQFGQDFGVRLIEDTRGCADIVRLADIPTPNRVDRSAGV